MRPLTDKRWIMGHDVAWWVGLVLSLALIYTFFIWYITSIIQWLPKTMWRKKYNQVTDIIVLSLLLQFLFFIFFIFKFLKLLILSSAYLEISGEI